MAASTKQAKKAILLAGGFGTRLRPFTFTCPKPMMPFANKPIIQHQIEALKKVGVEEIILALNYQPEKLVEGLQFLEKELGIKIIISREDTPMGTAGPLALARDILLEGGDEPFIMLNSDVSCEFPFQDLVNFHCNHGGEGTIMVTPVTDPSKYGVVLSEPDGKILSFIEKPQGVPPSNRINAGIYIFNKSVLSRIQLKPTSIERETFPAMAADGQLYCMGLEGFWCDVGQPADFIVGTALYLASPATQAAVALTPQSANIKGNVLIDPTATVSPSARLGPNVVIGAGCVVGDNARIVNSTLLSKVVVGAGAFISSSVIGWDSNIRSWAHLENCFFADDVSVNEGVVVTNCKVCPHKSVAEKADGAIIM